MSGQDFANEPAAGGNPVAPTAPRRRRLSFSLRALFVFMTVASVFCAWFASRIHPYYRQRDEMRQLVGKGVRIRTEPDPSIPDWVAKLLGDAERELFVCPQYVGLDMSRFDRYLLTDDDLRIVGGWRGVRTLGLAECPITDAGIESLSALTELEELYLNHTRITDSALAVIGRHCRRLRLLVIGATDISDDGLSRLARLPELESLGCAGCRRVQGHTLASVCTGARPLELQLRWCPIDDEGLAQAAQIARLHSLDVESALVTDVGVAHLSKAVELEQLVLSTPRVTDVGVAAVASLPRLERFVLDSPEITDKSLVAMASAPSLARLGLNRGEIGLRRTKATWYPSRGELDDQNRLGPARLFSREAVEQLKRAKPKLQIGISPLAR